jgi:hypothetical protein
MTDIGRNILIKGKIILMRRTQPHSALYAKETVITQTSADSI